MNEFGPTAGDFYRKIDWKIGFHEIFSAYVFSDVYYEKNIEKIFSSW